MRLYHLTDEVHWGLIALRGELVPRLLKEQQYGVATAGLGEAAGLPGVTEVMLPRNSEWDIVIDRYLWLTTNGAPRQLWMQGGGLNTWAKGQIRIEVDAPEAIPWIRVIRETNFPKRYADALAGAGGDPQEWYVTDEPIPLERWVEVVRTRDGMVLHRRDS